MAKKGSNSLVSPDENSRIAELMLKKEPLNPKLRRYVKETSIGPVFWCTSLRGRSTSGCTLPCLATRLLRKR